MLNLLTSEQLREADQFTILHKPISSIELMESAARSFVERFFAQAPYVSTTVSIYCGTGNNGGDGLAIARLLAETGCPVRVRIVRYSSKSSPDFDVNLEKVKASSIPLEEIQDSVLPEETSDLIIDAILGSGLNKALSGNLSSLVSQLNNLNKKVIAVDVPTGFSTEGPIDPDGPWIRADHVITFQRPKINFFFPESASAMRSFEVADIGLEEAFIQSRSSSWKLIEEPDIQQIIKPRKNYSHKGTYGHALIVAGKKETMGAALLSVKACIYAGAGLTSACIPESGLTALNTTVPEAMAVIRTDNATIADLEKYTSIAVGPGLGTDQHALTILERLLHLGRPLVLDADALNMLGANKELIKKLPEHSILTPHLKEFDRMFGQHKNWWDRLATARERASELKIIIVLKNRYTFVVKPDGEVLIDPTGNPRMASGGMGDVLTGMIASFLAQGYPSADAAMLACYIHGKCGEDIKGYVSPASRIISRIPEAIEELLQGNFLIGG